ncbi:MAG: tRNA (adenosine(37)-N6)-threonylcarbamoyltransferase complex transferase subunit TsaD, partial [Acidobacteriaceae bacterium]
MSLLPRGLILGIESSCDETAAAIVERGRHQLANVVASQIATHAPYGGVVPELASREHLRNIVPVVRSALAQAEIAFRDLDAIAVTEGPGLAGALLVGISYAKALAFALGKPLIAVNHLEGHIHAVLLEQAELGSAQGGPELELLRPELLREARMPGRPVMLALVVSGGHTSLYLAHEQAGAWHYRNVGRTLDDAAGEAFDKTAKLLGLGYPGGPWIDALAAHGDPNAVPFTFAHIKAKVHRRQDPSDWQHSAVPSYLFSFSGIKTAVLRYVELHNLKPSILRRRAALASQPADSRPDRALALLLCDAETLGLIASFQRAVIDDLKRKTFAAAEHFGAHALLVSGGVAADRELLVRLPAYAAAHGLSTAS